MKTTMSVIVMLFFESTISTVLTGQSLPEREYSLPESNRLNIHELDGESLDCMSCHIGSHGQVIELRPKGAPIEFVYDRWIRTSNHSIGMLYQYTYITNPSDYVSPADLNVNVRLIDGLVGCLSCHVKRKVSMELISSIVDGKFTKCTVDKETTDRAFQEGVCVECHVK